MKNKTLNHLAVLLITPCALAQEPPQKIEISPTRDAPSSIDLQVVPAEIHGTEAANPNLHRVQLEAARDAFSQAAKTNDAKELERQIAQMKNRLAELNAASRQQQELLQVKIQKMLEAQERARRVAKAQAQTKGDFASGFGTGAGNNYGGFARSIDLVAAPPAWLIGVQVQPQGEQGLKVVSLSKGLPASEAGFKREDIILSANGIKLKKPEALRSLIQAAEDQQLKFVIKRGEDAPITLQVTPKKNEVTMRGYSYEAFPRSLDEGYGSSGLSLTPRPIERQSDARLKKNLDQHPELKKLLNDYFEKHKKTD